MRDRTHLLTSLFEPQNIFQIVGKIAEVIERSYQTHGCARTAHEDKRRASICVDAVVLMRGDMGWSTSRILDHIGQALTDKLNGGTFTPSTRALWMPGDA